MEAPLTQIYPLHRTVSAQGIYLEHDLRSKQASQPFVYTNFITSLDGRISLTDPFTGRRNIPPGLRNSRDWRLYMELAAQSDVVLTSVRHLRVLAAGHPGDGLTLGEFPDLTTWRVSRGLRPLPVLAAIGRDLQFPAAALRARYAGPILLLAGAPIRPDKASELAGAEIEWEPISGRELDGKAVISAMARRGHGYIYSVGGPRISHALFGAGAVSRLYITLACLVFGGHEFDTLSFGTALSPPVAYDTRELYLDPGTADSAPQVFMVLDRRS